MRVLVACEFSGRVRDAFRALGHDAWSCDLLPTESDYRYHIVDDVRNHLTSRWDLMIAHPPCTHLAICGRRWWKDRPEAQVEALEFVRELLAAPIPRIALENPIGILSTKIRMPDQIIQPYQFESEEVKATCLWLKNLPLLVPTQVSRIRIYRTHNLTNTPWRWKIRSRTYKGIARAMAQQWGSATGYYELPVTRIREYHNRMAQVKHTRRKSFSLSEVAI